MPKIVYNNILRLVHVCVDEYHDSDNQYGDQKNIESTHSVYLNNTYPVTSDEKCGDIISHNRIRRCECYFVDHFKYTYNDINEI